MSVKITIAAMPGGASCFSVGVAKLALMKMIIMAPRQQFQVASDE